MHWCLWLIVFTGTLSLGFRLLPQHATTTAAQTVSATSPDGVWQELARGVPATARMVRLNRDALKRALERAPLEFTTEAAAHPATLMLPLPEGGFARFSIETSSVMEPGLAALFPAL